MKAAQDFELYEDNEGHLVPYYSGDSLKGIKKISVKKGKEIPSKHLKDLVNHLPDYVELKYKNNDMIIPEELRKKPKKEEKKPKGYTKEELNDMSFSKLKKIAEKLGQTGRSKTGLIKDILANQ